MVSLLSLAGLFALVSSPDRPHSIIFFSLVTTKLTQYQFTSAAEKAAAEVKVNAAVAAAEVKHKAMTAVLGEKEVAAAKAEDIRARARAKASSGAKTV